MQAGEGSAAHGEQYSWVESPHSAAMAFEQARSIGFSQAKHVSAQSTSTLIRSISLHFSPLFEAASERLQRAIKKNTRCWIHVGAKRT